MTHRAAFEVHETSELWDCYELWLESMQARQLAPKTLVATASKSGAFLRFLHEHLNLTTLDAVRPHHIRKWLILPPAARREQRPTA
jgi:hypothetical protein